MRRQVFAWALYDWGNSAFATTVMAAFFPVFFKDYWNAADSAVDSTFKLGLANSVASILVAVAAPLLGAVADRGGAKKRFLATFAGLGVVMTGGLFFVAHGDWLLAFLLYVLAIIGFSGSIVFYDSLIVSVSTPANSDRVSALGYSLGYLGGGVLFALNVWMTQSPQTFGLADAAQAVRVSFLLVALWWAAFSIPVMLLVPEPAVEGLPVGRALVAGARQLVATFKRLRELRPVWMFLLAYWLYIDGVDTVVRMAVDYGRSLGLGTDALLKALLITQFVGFPAALAYGWLGSRIGTRRAILIAIAAYFGVISWGYVMDSEAEFYGLAIVIGLFQGGIQALSRSYYSRLIPQGEAAEFFGFYNMLGKFAAVIGPVLMGLVAVATGSPRLSILSIGILLFAGGALLTRVEDPAAPEPHG